MTAAVTSGICPKDMTHGPCGGVALDGTCELGSMRCVYLERELVAWGGHEWLPRGDDPFAATAATRAAVVVDLPDRPLDASSTRRAAAGLAGCADGVLLGDVAWARVRFPPSYRASIVHAEGVRAWAGVSCRDRNRVALEGEVAALADLGAAVHCVTGDHTMSGHRPDAKAVFDLDSTELAALARAKGALVSVAENPVAPPIELRPARLREKARAGAQVCFINHPGSVATAKRFVDGARAVGVDAVTFLVCVPVVYSLACLNGIRTFTGLALPAGLERAIEEARDPFTVGIAHAAAFARAVLEIPGVRGVNLSGAYPAGDEERALEALNAVIGELR